MTNNNNNEKFHTEIYLIRHIISTRHSPCPLLFLQWASSPCQESLPSSKYRALSSDKWKHRHACMTINMRIQNNRQQGRQIVRAREILSPISSSFRFTGLIIFALDPLSAQFWVTSPPSQLESPLNRKVLSVRYRRGNSTHSRHHSDVFARPHVPSSLHSESFYLIIPPCGPLSGGGIRGATRNNVSCVNVACTKSLENWTSSSSSRASSMENRITERILDSFSFSFF